MPTENMEQQLPTAASVMPGQLPGDPGADMVAPAGAPGLIDDVTDGNATMATPVDTPQVNNMSDAKQAFADLLMAMQNGSQEMTAPVTPVQPEATEPVSPETQPVPETAPAEVQPPGFQPVDKDSLRAMLQEELQKAIAGGQHPELSAQDMTASVAENEVGTEETESVPEFNIPDINSDEFYAKFSDDPGAAIMEVAEAIAGKKNAELQAQLKPLLEQSKIVERNRRVQDAIKQFSDRDPSYGDFGKYQQSMVEYLKNGNFDMEDPNAYELAYNRAKASEYKNLTEQLKQTQGRTLADYMGDSESVQQMAQNEEVRKTVINEYLKSLANGEKPQVITDGTSNTPAGNNPDKAKTFREAGEMFKRML